MRILVLSDTHGDISTAKEVIGENKNIDLIIHLGDYFRDAQKLKDCFPDIPIEYIYGNSDFMIGDVPAEKLLKLEGKRLFITHGHKYSVNWDYDKLHIQAGEMNADILLFGHTHIPDIIKGKGYMLLNPGSISDPRGGSDESYAIIEITDGKINATLYTA